MDSSPKIRIGLKILNCNDLDAFIENAPLQVPFLKQRSIYGLYKELFKIFEGYIPENYPVIQDDYDLFEFQGFFMGVNDIQKYEAFSKSVTTEKYRFPKISYTPDSMTIKVEKIASQVADGGLFMVKDDPQQISFKKNGIFITNGSCDGLEIICGNNIQTFVIFCIFALQPSISIVSILTYLEKWRAICLNR